MTTPENVVSRFMTAADHFEVAGAITVSSPAIHAIQKEGERDLAALVGEDEAANLIADRRQRDGDKAHVTIVSPPEARKVLDNLAAEALAADPTLSKGKAKDAAKARLKELTASWKVGSMQSKGLGRAEAGSNEAYFVVLSWPEGRKIRESLGLDGDGQDFHVTVGFKGADVHGVRKNRPL